MKLKLLWSAVLLCAVLLSSSNASAGVWFELLHAPCWTGNPERIASDPIQPPGDGQVWGRYRGSVDCFNRDFNGGGARTTFSIKAFQPWEYGTMFLYYDITGPFNPANLGVTANEKGGFFGGITTTVSIKQVAQKLANAQEPFNWGPIANLYFKYEMEHVSKFGMLHYFGLQSDLAIPFMDFVTVTAVAREDVVYRGLDFQVGMAWQKSFSLGTQDFMFLGFFQWGLFGEGTHVDGLLNPDGSPVKGAPFFLSQPQLLWDVGKVIQFTPAKLYFGLEYQLAFNRYLIPNKTENVLQGMIRWNI